MKSDESEKLFLILMIENNTPYRK